MVEQSPCKRKNGEYLKGSSLGSITGTALYDDGFSGLQHSEDCVVLQ